MPRPFVFSLNVFQIIIIVLAIVWPLVQEFIPPSWVNDDLDEDS